MAPNLLDIAEDNVGEGKRMQLKGILKDPV